MSSKYKAIATTIDNIKFASKAEANRYSELKLLQRAGTISNLELQPRYPFVVNNIHVCTYVADFLYTEGQCLVAEDVKGLRLREYIIKSKLMAALYPKVELREISKRRK